MDPQTLEFYNKHARKLAEEYQAQAPERLYSLAKAFFIKGEPTLDLGCGTGRDAKWLQANDYPVLAVDASKEMLEIARANHPHLQTKEETLPRLTGLQNNTFRNVFCSAVIMHVSSQNILTATYRILEITQDGGIIILSFRGTRNEDRREEGRLFEPYSIGHLAQLFESYGGKLLFSETNHDEKRDKTWHTIVIRKTLLDQKAGISRIQDILERDSKVTTYKFALIRALCEISKYEASAVHWDHEKDMVCVPMKRIAYRWVGYYWHLIKDGIRQIQQNRKLGFETLFLQEIERTKDLSLFMRKLERKSLTDEQEVLIESISKAIEMPVEHAGGGHHLIFNRINKRDAFKIFPDSLDMEYGLVQVPMDIWRDISLFSHWIEDSLIIRWAEFIRKLYKEDDGSKYLAAVARSMFPERDTKLIRDLFGDHEVECVWSGKKIKSFDVDHMIPWTVWRNNDLWNLLPSSPNLNNNKSDDLPSPELIEKRFDVIVDYWKFYFGNFNELFERQLMYSLNLKMSDLSDKNRSMDSLIHTLQRIHINQGTEFWKYMSEK